MRGLCPRGSPTHGTTSPRTIFRRTRFEAKNRVREGFREREREGQARKSTCKNTESASKGCDCIMPVHQHIIIFIISTSPPLPRPGCFPLGSSFTTGRAGRT
jgi:hypothetical protein